MSRPRHAARGRTAPRKPASFPTHRRGSHPCQSAAGSRYGAATNAPQSRPGVENLMPPTVALCGRLRDCPPHAPNRRDPPRSKDIPMTPLSLSALRAPPRKALVWLAAGAMVAAAAFVARAQAPDPVIAKVNGIEIHQSDLALAEEDVGQNLPQGSAEAKRDYLVSYLSDMILLAQAAEERRLQ